mgnify:CR=1 FL=1
MLGPARLARFGGLVRWSYSLLTTADMSGDDVVRRCAPGDVAHPWCALHAWHAGMRYAL